MKIEIDDNEINVEDIIRKMKIELSKHNITENIHDLSLDNILYDVELTDVDLNLLYEKINIVNRSWNTNPEYKITSHRKIIGPFIVFGKKVVRKFLRWYINPYASGQNEFNASVTRSFNELLTYMEKSQEQLKTANDKIDTLAHLLEDKNKQIQQLELLINEQKIDILSLIDGKDQLINSKFEDILKKVDTQFEQVITNSEILELKHTNRVSNERLRRIERKLRDVGVSNTDLSSPMISKNKEIEQTGLDFDYFLFEEYYRGSRQEIIDRQRQYLSYFSPGKTVLDLGCGRGEMTELLLQNNVNVISVDIDDDMISYCRDRGFNVIKMDLLEYLHSLEDNSVDGIFLGQVIEHLKPEDIISMVKFAYKKLTPNSWLIAETPNPRSLSIFAQSFYLDLTHNKPVHPFTAKFIWETEGFRETEVNYLSPNNPILQLPPLSIPTMDADTINRFNAGLKHWNDILFGDQDYYVAGRK